MPELRLLDRLFGQLVYPLDILLPSGIWLIAGAALLAAAWRRWHVGAALAAALVVLNAIGWVFGFAMRVIGDGAVSPWVLCVEAPFAAARGALREALWHAAGVMAAPDPAMLFRGYSSWNGDGSVLLAGLLNESAAIALAAMAAAIAAAAWRAATRAGARKAGRAQGS